MNAPRLRVVLAAASMSVAWPLVVSAQTRAWDNYCTQGTFQACMSVDVSLLLVPGPPGGVPRQCHRCHSINTQLARHARDE